jgi:hypothetical protein
VTFNTTVEVIPSYALYEYYTPGLSKAKMQVYEEVMGLLYHSLPDQTPISLQDQIFEREYSYRVREIVLAEEHFDESNEIEQTINSL